MKNIILTAIVLFVIGCSGNDKKASANETLVEADTRGEVLFKANCASCHKPEKDFVAPPLKGTLLRWNGDKKALYEFIRNPTKSENAQAIAIRKKYAPIQMTAFPVLEESAIDDILNYCENYKATR